MNTLSFDNKRGIHINPPHGYEYGSSYSFSCTCHRWISILYNKLLIMYTQYSQKNIYIDSSQKTSDDPVQSHKVIQQASRLKIPFPFSESLPMFRSCSLSEFSLRLLPAHHLVFRWHE